MFGIGHYISNKRYTQYAMVPLAWGSSPFARAPALKRLISTLIKVFNPEITSFLNINKHNHKSRVFFLSVF